MGHLTLEPFLHCTLGLIVRRAALWSSCSFGSMTGSATPGLLVGCTAQNYQMLGRKGRRSSTYCSPAVQKAWRSRSVWPGAGRLGTTAEVRAWYTVGQNLEGSVNLYDFSILGLEAVTEKYVLQGSSVAMAWQWLGHLLARRSGQNRNVIFRHQVTKIKQSISRARHTLLFVLPICTEGITDSTCRLVHRARAHLIAIQNLLISS